MAEVNPLFQPSPVSFVSVEQMITPLFSNERCFLQLSITLHGLCSVFTEIHSNLMYMIHFMLNTIGAKPENSVPLDKKLR